MGTRSITHIKNDAGKTIMSFYRQYDGYPQGGHGEELAEFLSGMKIVNGFGDTTQKQANGMGCLAAQLIAHLKDGVGNIYIVPPDQDDMWEEYTYVVQGHEGMPEPTIAVYDTYGDEGHKLFEGSASDMLAWCQTPVEEEED